MRYFSSVGLELGGSQVEGILNGCLGLSVWFLKKYLSLIDRAKVSKSFDSSSRVVGLGVGANMRPLDRIEAVASVSEREERLVMCFLSLILLILL